MKNPIVSPSLLSANFNELSKDIEMINRSQADWFHLDIMDGVFVPNISFGFPIVSHVNKLAKKPLDVHLMIVDPDRYIKDFKNAGADYLTVHYEACPHLHRTIQAIKAEGMKAGVSLNPHTPVSSLEDVVADIDLVLLMSVNPGFGGQKYIENTYKKIKQLRELSKDCNPNLIIEIDGGVDNSNAQKLVDAGANALVAGSYVFKSEQPEQTITKLKTLDF
jgi:ribulose-phosphate 3-epimerase